MSRPEVTMLRAHGNPPESIFTGWLGPPNCSDGPPSTERTTIIRANPSRPALRNQTRLSGKAQILAQEKHRDDWSDRVQVANKNADATESIST